MIDTNPLMGLGYNLSTVWCSNFPPMLYLNQSVSMRLLSKEVATHKTC